MGNQVFGGLKVLAEVSSSDRKAENSYPKDIGSFHLQMPGGVKDGGGRPCRACTDFKSWAKFQAQKRKEEGPEEVGGGAGSSLNSNSGLNSRGRGGVSAPALGGGGGADFNNGRSQSQETEEDIEQQLRAERIHLQCPLDKDELGRSTWGYLHTMAAYFPDKPSKNQEKEMSAFIKIFAKYYPCEHCAQDFQKSIKESPPETWSREIFSLWLCKMHNEVNRKLGKPEFDCGKVDERWRDGWRDGSCDFDF